MLIYTLLLTIFNFKIIKSSIYTPNTYPDSLINYATCGIDHPSLICDVDNLLNDSYDGKTKGIKLLDKALENIRKNTKCVCDELLQNDINEMRSVCKEDEGKLKGGGYTISIVILERMEVSDKLRRRYRTGTPLPAIFAASLKNRLNRGRCNDDALIVLSINDSSLQTSTGGVISTKLTNEFVLNVSRIAQTFFIRRQFTKGLLYIIDEFADRLGAKSTDWVDLYFWIFFPEVN
uniref:Uncharacterized protein n=1 Tax=Meloidogyne hapla TaxID=6305 RepID=A0A1I8BK36_MELHA